MVPNPSESTDKPLAAHHSGAPFRLLRVVNVDPVRVANEHWRALGPHMLTQVRHEALAVLYFSRRGEMMMGELGKRLLVHPTSVTSTVDTLERLKLVARVAHPTDRRATLARITMNGRRAIEASNDGMLETRFGLAVLTDAQAKVVTKILSAVRLSG